MDTASKSAVTFLSSCQDRMQQLRELSRFYMEAGAARAKVASNLSGVPFTVRRGESVIRYDGCIPFALYVRAVDQGPEYELAVSLYWRDEAWRIETEARLENEDGGSTLIRELPARTATDLASCLAHLEAAIAELPSFKDCVFGG